MDHTKVLPLQVTVRRSAVAPDSGGVLTLAVRLPDGLRLTGANAGDGWKCRKTGNGASCTRNALHPGQSSTAKLRIKVGHQAAGVRTLTATATLHGWSATGTYPVLIVDGKGPHSPKHHADGKGAAGSRLA